MRYYIPYRQIVYLCKFRSEETFEDGTSKCLHPSILETWEKPGKCTSNCIARQILESVIVPVIDDEPFIFDSLEVI